MSKPDVDPPRMALDARRLALPVRQTLMRGHHVLVPMLAERARWTVPALLIRLVQVVAGLVVLLLAPTIRPLVAVLMLAGLLAAVLSPSRTGAAIAVGAGVAGWVSGYGAHGSPPVIRVLAFALALYVLHDATSLAGTVPLTAELRREALLAWLRRSGLALLVAGLLALAVYGVGWLVDLTSSYPLMVAGLFGIVATLAAAAVLFSRSLR